jgi:hypothetical protein
MKKSTAIKTLASLLFSGMLLCSYQLLRSENRVNLHAKLKVGEVKDDCYCTGINVCVEAPSGLVACGSVIPCSTNDNLCTVSE